jgi:hypothetical protein
LGFGLFLAFVLFPTLPPYKSDTSISFFMGVGGEGEYSLSSGGWGEKVLKAQPFGRVGMGRKRTVEKGGGWEKIGLGGLGTLHRVLLKLQCINILYGGDES